MKRTGRSCWKTILFLPLWGVLVLGSPVCVRAQANGHANSVADPHAAEPLSLIESIRELQAQVQDLSAQVSRLRAEGEQAREELRVLRLGIDSQRPRVDGQPAGELPNSSAGLARTGSLPKELLADDPAPEESAAGPNGQMQEDLQLTNAKLDDQYQTKVESGSKYRVRLSGIVLLNLFANRGNFDSLDVPQIAVAQPSLGSPGSFGGSLRQSQIGIQAFGPNVGSAHTSAEVKFDFAGAFPLVPNGIALGQMRLRTGTIRLDWANTSVIAGQDTLFFAPLAPTSLASLAIPALSYAGNLWAWTPQVRLEHRVTLSDNSNLSFQAAILDSFSGDLSDEYSRVESWGEQSGQPAYAARIAWTHRIFGQNLTVGAGGYYGRQNWGFSRNIDGWAGTTDLTLPLGKFFGLTGQFYRGRAVAGLGGAIGQDVLTNGSLIAPATLVRGVDSMGGWAQLKFKPTAKFEINGAFGQDNPFANELRLFPKSRTYFGSLLSRNQSEFGNFIYRLRSNVLFSVEYRRLRTSTLDGGSVPGNYVNTSLGYTF